MRRARVMAGLGLREASLTSEFETDVSFLTGELHGDPADRLIVTSARHLGVPVVTRDPRIIACGRDGHVQVIPCCRVAPRSRGLTSGEAHVVVI